MLYYLLIISFIIAYNYKSKALYNISRALRDIVAGLKSGVRCQVTGSHLTS